MILQSKHILIVLIILLTACSNPERDAKKAIPKKLPQAAESLKNLEEALNTDRIRNAVLLKNYADILKKERPELNDLLNTLALDATPEGAMYRELQNRLDTAKSKPQSFDTAVYRLAEIEGIIDGADTETYNAALTDVVNVVADMSNGKLARINAPDNNKNDKLGNGSHLIGNPAYGRWNQRSGGSYWHWYPAYSYFHTGPYYSYSYWNRHRGWSYYSDIGHDYYGTYRYGTRYDPSSSRSNNSMRNTGVKRKSYSKGATRRASVYSKTGTRSRGSRYASSFRGSGGSRGFRGK